MTQREQIIEKSRKDLKAIYKEALKKLKALEVDQRGELEVGKWYINNYGSKYLAYAQELKGTIIIKGYGFDDSGNWEVFAPTDASITECRKATPQEVEKALIEEAKRRYKVGDVIKCLDGVESELNGTDFVFNNNSLFSNGERIDGGAWFNTYAKVFDNGQWATIIEQDKFADLKEAYRNGAVIQFYEEKRKKWYDCGMPCWNPTTKYRIQPEELTTFNDLINQERFVRNKINELAKQLGISTKGEGNYKPEEKPKVGDVCKFWDNNEDDFFIAKLHSISDGEFPYTAYKGCSDFMNARVITPQQVQEMLFPNQQEF